MGKKRKGLLLERGKARKKKANDDRVNRERGKVRYRTRTSESKRTTTRGGALCRRRAEAGEAQLAVWVMYWHMYVIVAICRESERPEEARGWQMERDGEG